MLFVDACEQGSVVAIGSGGGKDDRQDFVNWLRTRSIQGFLLCRMSEMFSCRSNCSF